MSFAKDIALKQPRDQTIVVQRGVNYWGIEGKPQKMSSSRSLSKARVCHLDESLVVARPS